MPGQFKPEWVLLTYKIPNHPTRLRLQIWRKLQRMGAVYLQDAVCLLPALPEHVENMQYIAEAIEEMGGTCCLFSASALYPTVPDDIAQEFRALANRRLDDIANRLDKLPAALDSAMSLHMLEQVEDDLKRERLAYLRAKKLSFFGSDREAEVDSRLDRIKQLIDAISQGDK